MKIELFSRVTIKALIMSFAITAFLPLSVAHAESASTFQVAEVHTFPGEPLPTTSGGTLLRNKNKVSAHLAMHGLDEDSTYSVWWVIFNDPENCSGGIGTCGPPDFEASNASILNASGFVTGSSGSANFTAHLEARRPPAGMQVEFGKGLLPGKGYGAEIHMLFLSHGDVMSLEGEVGQHISYTAGGVPQYGIAFLPQQE